MLCVSEQLSRVGAQCRVETERAEWMKERDEKLESMTAKQKELKASLKERNRAMEELERRLHILQIKPNLSVCLFLCFLCTTTFFSGP